MYEFIIDLVVNGLKIYIYYFIILSEPSKGILLEAFISINIIIFQLMSNLCFFKFL